MVFLDNSLERGLRPRKPLGRVFVPLGACPPPCWRYGCRSEKNIYIYILIFHHINDYLYSSHQDSEPDKSRLLYWILLHNKSVYQLFSNIENYFTHEYEVWWSKEPDDNRPLSLCIVSLLSYGYSQHNQVNMLANYGKVKYNVLIYSWNAL